MTKVKINHQTPSEEVVAKANTTVSVADCRGRTFTLKRPGPLAQFRLIEALGQLAENRVYFGMVMPLLFLTAINGEPVFTPSSKREIEALIQQLDEDGLEAVMQGVHDNFGNPDSEKEKAELKN